MAFPVRACALVGRFADSRVAESVSALLPRLKARCAQVLVIDNGELPDWLNGDVVPVPEEQIAERADIVIAIGGDGTLLYAARMVARHSVPLLGIKGISIICHGRSSAKAIKNAIREAVTLKKADLPGALSRGVAKFEVGVFTRGMARLKSFHDRRGEMELSKGEDD